MNVTILGTGSRGNAIVVECDGDRVLVDAGFPARTLAQRLRATGHPPESISALILTHAHGDHACGARVAARRYGWTVYATPGTIHELPELAVTKPVPISPRETLLLDTMVVSSVRIPHDCLEPVAVAIESRRTGARCGIAYDLGHAPASVERALSQVDALVLESNHDEDMLRNGPYPRSVQRRISGGRGHLSNRAAARMARNLAHHGLRHVVLAHVSAQNNTAAAAHGAVSAALHRTPFRGDLTVAGQDAATSFTVERARRAEQMNLFGR
ncbi:MAG: MBL fold metallo-hydrolase [Gemmatimonadaceae bacterium]|nr:MBL fold metallo-hydrolase [Gemmatimonadaceae bacterium]